MLLVFGKSRIKEKLDSLCVTENLLEPTEHHETMNKLSPFCAPAVSAGPSALTSKPARLSIVSSLSLIGSPSEQTPCGQLLVTRLKTAPHPISGQKSSTLCRFYVQKALPEH